MRAARAPILVAMLLLGACVELEVTRGTPTPASQTSTSPTPVATATVQPDAEGVVLSSGDAEVTVEVVATQESRQRGLMFRESLPDDAGMLFLFPGDARGGFWMKNTLIPLSIGYMAWDGDTFEVLAIMDMEPCEADPCPSYDSGETYRAALEVNQGWFADNGVQVGDVFTAEGQLPAPS